MYEIENKFNGIDYAVFIVMLSISAGIGLYYGFCGKTEETTAEFLLGSKKMKTIPIAISLIASQVSSLSIMTFPVEIYTFGTDFAFTIPFIAVAIYLINYVFLPVFYDNNIDNCYVYLEMRFSKSVRTLGTVLFLLMLVLLLPPVQFVPALALSQVTGGNVHFINAITCGVCVFYTMLGGIKAVVWTDVVQATTMVLALVAIAILGLTKVGGLEEMWSRGIEGGRLKSINLAFNLTDRITLWSILSQTLVMWCSYVGFNQGCVQRLVALPSLKHARRSLLIFGIGVTIFLGINCTTGLIMYSYYYDCDPIKINAVTKPDKLVPYFVEELSKNMTGMSGLFISCIFSASLSTISANFNAISGIVYADYIRPLNLFEHSDRKANIAMKVIILLSGIYCILAGFLVEQFASLFQTVISLLGISQGALFSVFTLGMLYPRTGKKSVMLSAIISIVFVGYMVLGAQMLAAQGKLVYTQLPTSIDGCQGFNMTTTPTSVFLKKNATTSSPNIISNNEEFSLFKIAFPWYVSIGAVLVWILAIPLSHIFESNEIDNLNPDLIANISKWMLPKKLKRIKVPTKEIDDNKCQNDVLNNDWKWISHRSKIDEE